MIPGIILADPGPQDRVLIAVAPFVATMFLRFTLGHNGLTRWLITLSTVWFAANVLMALTTGMRQNLRYLVAWLP